MTERKGLSALQRLGPVLAVALLVVSFASLHHELRGVTWTDVRSDLTAISLSQLGIALLLTVLNYVILTGYDALALLYAGVRLRYGRVALASTVGYAFSQGLGFPLLTGAPVRFRLYSAWGVGALDVGRTVAFYTSTFWVGLACAAGFSFLLWPVHPPAALGLSSGSRIAGGLLLAALVLYVGWSVSGRGSLSMGPLELEVPKPRLVVGQIAIGVTDWLVAGSVLWMMLPEGHALGFGPFLSTYLLAQTAGVASHLPGGLGVFEAVMLAFLPHGPQHGRILASLLAFRLVFYMMPLVVASMTLALRELLQHREAIAHPTLGAARSASQLVPAGAAALTFVLGALLLLSGSVPLPAGRLQAFGSLLPLPFLELGHFLGSVTGAGLLLLARGLQRRLDGAYHLSLAALLASAVLFLARDLHPAAGLGFLLAAGILFVSRREFYRPASLLDEPFSPSWILAIGAAVATFVWLGFFAFKHVSYSNDLWWQFAFEEDAPRFLRATVGVAVLLSMFTVARLLRPAPVRAEGATEQLLGRVEPIVQAAADPQANLVFLGDKNILMSGSGRSFIMYGVSRSSWVVMGDPVGDPEEFDALGWELKDQADRAGAQLVFYEASPAWLPLYIDLGLVFYKLGEDARVPLEGFTLQGKSRAELRHAKSRLEREGGTFEVVAAHEVEHLLPDLRRVSDDWLATRDVREKRFSLGRFEDAYVRRFPCAVIRVHDEPVAFATLWTSTAKEEVTIDLMRYGADAPKGVMDALFAHLLEWGAAEGYRWFGLGMAPFSGMEAHRLAPTWQKMGAALYRYGEHFYNFQGLRDYKDKFSPVWEPRYLAAPPGLGVARVLADVTILISGGLLGSVMR